MEAAAIKKEVRVRIAPSPTGLFHVGTARTALFNYLFAKKHGGTFIVRIEDTDVARSEKRYEEDILAGLSWLGLSWDEGPQKDGAYGPYHQSERIGIYRRHLEILFERGLAYHCFCTKEELEAQKNYMMASGLAPKYSGRCAALTSEETDAKIKAGMPFVIRFRTPARKVSFTDAVKGKIEVDTELIGDFTIAKGLDEPLYNFAAAVDDELMKISHVIRGEDHISNTPKQIMLQEAFGFHSPVFAHLPLLLGTDKSKLSKRHGAKSIMEYREEGYLPEAIVNFLAFLGWNPGTDRELFTLAELEQHFDLAQAQRSNAVFNMQKLDWFNAHYIRQKSAEQLYPLCAPYLEEAGIAQAPRERVEKVIAIEKDRMKKLSDIADLAAFFFVPPAYAPEMLVWKKSDAATAKETLTASAAELEKMNNDDFTAEKIKEALAPVAARFGNGETYWPLRVALSGKEASPGPVEIADVLGKEETLRRIRTAIALV